MNGAHGAIILQLYHRQDFLTQRRIIDLLHFLQPEKLTRIDHWRGLIVLLKELAASVGISSQATNPLSRLTMFLQFFPG